MSLPALATATSAHLAANCANATSPQRSAHRIPYNDHAAHRANATSQQRSAHRIPYNDCAAHRANATSPQRSAHRIPYNDHAARIAQMQPVRRGPRIARRTRVTRPPWSAHASQCVCVSLFYVIDTGSIRPQARILGGPRWGLPIYPPLLLRR